MGVARWAVLWVALILFSCMPALAQTGGEGEGEGASGSQYEEENPGTGALGPDAECPGARVVNTTTGDGNKQSPIFGITGDSFRVITVLAATGDPQDIFFSADVNNGNGRLVTSIDRESPGTDSSIVNAGPGDFFLDILAANVEYSIVVEDCADAGGNGDDNNGSGQGNDNGDDQEGDVDDPNDVMAGTGDDGPLPNTGGVPLALGAASLVILAALAARRMVAP